MHHKNQLFSKEFSTHFNLNKNIRMIIVIKLDVIAVCEVVLVQSEFFLLSFILLQTFHFLILSKIIFSFCKLAINCINQVMENYLMTQLLKLKLIQHSSYSILLQQNMS